MTTLPERQDAPIINPPETNDPLPELCHYQDEGCELATRELGRPSRCARCPFPDCVYSEPQGQRKWLKGLRDQAVIAGFLNDRKTVRELAGLFRISIRTVQRVIKGFRND